MLDQQTKRKIDNARDILVGKVPDPKSQVEQITIALIYKFMDDMDRESEEWGGKATFFTGEYEKYAWSKVFDPRMGGFDLIALYGDAIVKMNQNPKIPQLFRDIFKNAYLPYRDPETLRSFLKEINEFKYDHSERLGDAYESLLSIMDKQGDAGQFRTPRHIIDFIVEIVDPKKNETVLDPACGTAGFLISSYKHILKANTKTRPGDKLTPDERKRLLSNFAGYDISPDMVRLSLVNMYLHGFSAPKIVEYDTLTSEERWNDTSDVMLANPPFMTPKGGIRPHKRFSIQAKRSEVLFVDYIAEHLNPHGRAGVIVPEGIIFQSQTAYRNLRKMLVEGYLWAVVSLPAGIFNPYAGVKTSILFLDKALAKKTDKILFVKIENDGYDLGAQRRPVNKNDLPQAHAEIGEYLRQLRARESVEDFKPTLGLIVAKQKIAANRDYNLSGVRYREGGPQSANYPWRKIESLIETITPPVKIQKTAFGKTGRFPIIDQSQEEISGWTDDESALIRPSKPLVVFGDHTCAVKLVETPFAQGADGIKILWTVDTLDPRFLYYMLRIRPLESSGYQRHFSKLKEHEIPLPPLDVQKVIVAEIDGYQKIIDGARQVVENYRPHISIDQDWPMVAIEDLVANERNSLKAGPFGSSLKKECYVKSGYKIYGQEQVIRGDINFGDYYISEEKFRELESCKVKAGDVLISLVGTYGKILIVPEKHEHGIINPRLLKVTLDKKKIMPAYFVEAFRQDAVTKQVASLSYGGTMDILSLKILKSLKLPLPPLATQQQIVAEIEAEQEAVNATKTLISMFGQKIKDKISEIWGDTHH